MKKFQSKHRNELPMKFDCELTANNENKKNKLKFEIPWRGKLGNTSKK